ncbi:MAG: arsenate reductase ArsC [Ignavibacteriaceae bacterium]|jgi:arsenate reductase
MDKIKVLFVCVHNSARSQMAEAFLNEMGNDKFIAESAGLEPGVLNPVVVDVMKEIGFDLSNNKTKSVFEFFKQGKKFEYVVTVCDEANSERCPIFPSAKQTLHWSFKDPSGIKGTYEEKLAQTKIIRDAIKSRLKKWIEELNQIKV